MRIGDIMSTQVLAVEPTVDADVAWRAMRSARIHHLAVIDGKRLVGVLSERDLGGPRGASLRKGHTAGELMSPRAVVASPATTLREAANLLRGRTIGCLPVIADDQLVGMITTTDLLEMIGRGTEKALSSPRPWVLRGRGNRRAVERRRGPGTGTRKSS